MKTMADHSLTTSPGKQSEINRHRIHRVDIMDIDAHQKPYCMSFCFDIGLLTLSIHRVGLITPPLVIEKEGRKQIISGYRRILALRSLGWKTVPCRVLTSSEFSPLECLLLNFFENISFRKFNEIEKAMILNRLSSHIEPDEILAHYMPLLDLPSKVSFLNFYCRLDRELEDPVKEAVIKEKLSLRTAKAFLDMPGAAKRHLFNLLSNVTFNKNQQRQLIEWLIDISHSDKVCMSSILQEGIYEKIISDSRMNNPQKANALLKALRSRLYPRLCMAEKTFKKTVSSLNLPERTRLRHSSFFESPEYCMEIRFQDGRDLGRKIEKLSKMKGLLNLNDPWESNV